MRALILAAGLGTRLLPHTKYLPKPLFPIAGRPLLDIIIHNLYEAGCREMIINTHHLYEQIEKFVAEHPHAPLLTTRHEADILGTGGAIKNVADLLGSKPLLVINSDIFTDIDLRSVYDFHLSHDYPATLVLHDCDAYNNVSVTTEDLITGFHQDMEKQPPPPCTRLAFTGIQVVDPELTSLVPEKKFYSSIDMYRNAISSGRGVKAFISRRHFWKDIGTPSTYREVAYENCSRKAFKTAFPDSSEEPIACRRIQGDGSDRQWFRLTAGSQSLILADHGIRGQDGVAEVDSFISIAQHLRTVGTPVPAVYFHDAFSGLVFLEDMGDENFQNRILNRDSRKGVIDDYKKVIDLLIQMSFAAGDEFDPSKAYQTPAYDRTLIVEKECNYFVRAFLNAFLGFDVDLSELSEDFLYLADHALQHAVTGFMHRDFQSRNIMVRKNQFYFIDFQGGRLGPIQYDLASLLIDPYVRLPDSEQEQLAAYCAQEISMSCRIDPIDFLKSYQYCRLTRNLQILGAFGYLSKTRGKKWFEQYIPAAVQSLKTCIKKFDPEEMIELRNRIDTIPDPDRLPGRQLCGQ